VVFLQEKGSIHALFLQVHAQNRTVHALFSTVRCFGQQSMLFGIVSEVFLDNGLFEKIMQLKMKIESIKSNTILFMKKLIMLFALSCFLFASDANALTVYRSIMDTIDVFTEIPIQDSLSADTIYIRHPENDRT
jgi:hypothetical protein